MCLTGQFVSNPIFRQTRQQSDRWDGLMETLQEIKGPDNPTRQLLPIMSTKCCRGDGERRKDKGCGGGPTSKTKLCVCVTKLYVKDGVWRRNMLCVTKLCVKVVTKLCVKDGEWQSRVCVCVKDGVLQRWCVKKGVWKMVCERGCVGKMVCERGCVKGVSKMVCERWSVAKMVCERWCVWKLCVKGGVWQSCVGQCGVWQSGVWKMVWRKMVCDKVINCLQPGLLQVSHQAAFSSRCCMSWDSIFSFSSLAGPRIFSWITCTQRSAKPIPCSFRVMRCCLLSTFVTNKFPKKPWIHPSCKLTILKLPKVKWTFGFHRCQPSLLCPAMSCRLKACLWRPVSCHVLPQLVMLGASFHPALGEGPFAASAHLERSHREGIHTVSMREKVPACPNTVTDWMPVTAGWLKRTGSNLATTTWCESAVLEGNDGNMEVGEWGDLWTGVREDTANIHFGMEACRQIPIPRCDCESGGASKQSGSRS